MKTRILFAVIASAGILLSFSLTSGSPKKTSEESIPTAKAPEPAGGLVVEAISR